MRAENVSARDVLSPLIEKYKGEMIDTMSHMISIPAISPESGGSGESKRADFLESILKGFGVETKRFDYKDESGAVRSNIIARYGSTKKVIWIVSHIDTVSAGDLSLWNTDPFKAHVSGGKLYGRGSCDNGQAVIASIYALKALLESKAKLKYGIGIALVADEEIGSTYGIKKLLGEGIFGKGDMYVVPDWGTPDGSKVEVAEKGVLWLKIKVTGKQTHASTPEQGANAYRYMIRLLNELDERLHEKYNNKNPIFEPPFSTFEMTKREPNVDSVNIIPGTDVSFMDCRVLPDYALDDVLSYVNSIAAGYAKYGVKVEIEPYSRDDAARPTDMNSELVKLLAAKIYKLRGVKITPVGIGGGTVARYFREGGMQTVVWSTLEDVAHEPNEYAIIENMVNDAKVFSNLYV